MIIFTADREHSNRQYLQVRDDDALVQILCFWILFIVLILSKTLSCLRISKHNVSETRFCLRLQVKHNI
jgi:hypothetical protein